MNEDLIKSEIEQAVAQVDASLTVDDFATDYDSAKRGLTVHFTAKSTGNEDMSINVAY